MTRESDFQVPARQANGSASIRVGLDAEALGYPPSGIRTYVEALIEQTSARDYGIELELLRSERRMAARLPRKARRFWWDVYGAGAAGRSASIDVLHLPHGAAPVRQGIPTVVTVHDVIPLTEAAYRRSRSMRLYQRIMMHSIPKAAAVIVPSRVVATAVQELYDLPASHIHVVPMAAGSKYVPTTAQELPEALRAIGVRQPYVFNIGGFDARKNLPALLEAFSQFSRDAAGSWQLVIGGAPHTENQFVFPPLEPEIERLGLGEQVLLTGRVSEETKIALYQHAGMYVTPSLHEGFGMTVLEAMACGVAVIASNRTSLPEVAGDAALLVEPEPDAIAAAMRRLGGGAGLRTELRRRGIERAAEFSWERTAEMTAAVYRLAAESGVG